MRQEREQQMEVLKAESALLRNENARDSANIAQLNVGGSRELADRAARDATIRSLEENLARQKSLLTDLQTKRTDAVKQDAFQADKAARAKDIAVLESNNQQR